MALYTKGEMVKYPNGEYMVRAIVRTCHQDGTRTVEAQHLIDANGKTVGPYIGYKFRLPSTILRYAL